MWTLPLYCLLPHFFLVCVDWWVIAPCLPWIILSDYFQRSLFLLGFHQFGSDAYILFISVNLSQCGSFFFPHLRNIWLSLFLLCFLLLILGPLFSYFTNSSCIEMRRLDIFSQGFEDILKALFLSLVIRIWKFYWFAFKFPIFFFPRSFRPVISLDLCYILISDGEF